MREVRDMVARQYDDDFFFKKVDRFKQLMTIVLIQVIILCINNLFIMILSFFMSYQPSWVI